MSEIVFLLEEPSMEMLLRGLLPRLLPAGVRWTLVPHEGKTDLQRSIVRKLRAWGAPQPAFVILMDQDSADCHALKSELQRLCRDGGRPDALVRIVCHELESWLLGDLAALEIGLGQKGLAKKQVKAKYRVPDKLANAAEELKKLAPGYQKIAGARAVAPHLSLETNASTSFKIFTRSVLALAGATVPATPA